MVAVLSSLLGCSKSDPPARETGAAPPPSAPAAPAKAAAPKRGSIDCAAILAGSAQQGAVYQAGGWGKLPAELQVLPPGAELCGSGSPTGSATFPGVLIRSALFGPALGAFYAPLATKLGCTAGEAEIVSSGDRQSTRLSLRCPNGKRGYVTTDTGNEFYSLSITL